MIPRKVPNSIEGTKDIIRFKVRQMFGNEGPKYIWLFKGRIQLWGDLSLSFDIGSKTESDDKYKLGEKKAVTNSENNS